MHLDWSFILSALGLAFIIEGLPYFIWAEKMPKFLLLMASRPASALRMTGLVAMLAGLLLIYLARL